MINIRFHLMSNEEVDKTAFVDAVSVRQNHFIKQNQVLRHMHKRMSIHHAVNAAGICANKIIGSTVAAAATATAETTAAAPTAAVT